MSLELYDIMGSDHQIFAHLERNGEITTVVNDEDGSPVFSETSHIAAWLSLTYFAKQVLDCDAYIQKQLDMKNGF